MTKQQLIDRLKSGAMESYMVIPVSNVIEMLEKMDEETSISSKPSDDDISLLSAHVSRDILDMDKDDIISDYDLSLNGREIEIDSVELNDYRIEDVIEESIRNFFAKR